MDKTALNMQIMLVYDLRLWLTNAWSSTALIMHVMLLYWAVRSFLIR